MPVRFEGFFASIGNIPLFDIGTDPVVLNQLEEIPNQAGEVVELLATVDFRIAGPLRFFEFLRDGVVVATYREFARQGTDSVLTMITDLTPPPSVSTYALRTRGGSQSDDVFRSTLSVKVLDPVDP